jgi:hypothetical protein
MSQENVRVTTAVLAAVTALALAVGCGDDDETAQTTTTTEAVKLGVEEQIEQVGNEWAPLFARDVTAACRYMFGQPLCEEFWGKPGGEPAEVRRPSEFQESFADATVERVEIKGHKAGAEFSSGELVEFIQETEGPPRLLGDWFIYDVGGNAGKTYFEP